MAFVKVILIVQGIIVEHAVSVIPPEIARPFQMEEVVLKQVAPIPVALLSTEVASMKMDPVLPRIVVSVSTGPVGITVHRVVTVRADPAVKLNARSVQISQIVPNAQDPRTHQCLKLQYLRPILPFPPPPQLLHQQTLHPSRVLFAGL